MRRDRYFNQTGRTRLIEQFLGSAPDRPKIVLTVAAAKKWLMMLRSDQFAIQNGINLAAVARVLGITNQHLNDQIYRPGKNLRLAAVEKIMLGIDSGELCFMEKRGVWIEKPSPLSFEDQAPLVDSYRWSYWKRCKSCGGRRYVRLDLIASAACLNCIPDPRVVGGVISKDRLPLPIEARRAA